MGRKAKAGRSARPDTRKYRYESCDLSYPLFSVPPVPGVFAAHHITARGFHDSQTTALERLPESYRVDLLLATAAGKQRSAPAKISSQAGNVVPVRSVISLLYLAR